mgnify:CR=1 FL=1
MSDTIFERPPIIPIMRLDAPRLSAKPVMMGGTIIKLLEKQKAAQITSAISFFER